MSQAPSYLTESDIPAKIRDRFDPSLDPDYLAFQLSAMNGEYPGMFDAIVRVIDKLESYVGIVNTTVDYYEEDTLYPVTIWAESAFSEDEREQHLIRIHDLAMDVLGPFKRLVLVAVM